MKKIVSLILSMLILACNSSILFCADSSREYGQSFTKMSVKSLAIGGAAAAGLAVLGKFRLPVSLIFALGYYGSLASFGVLSYRDLSYHGAAGEMNAFGFIVLPALLTLSFLGLVPLAGLVGLGRTR